MLRLIIPALAALALTVSTLRAQNDYYWSGEGGDALMSNDANWIGGVAPGGAVDSLQFSGTFTNVVNDIPGATFAAFNFMDGGFVVSGSTAQGLRNIGIYNPSEAVTVKLDLDIETAGDLNFQFLNFSAPQGFQLTQQLRPAAGSKIYANGMGMSADKLSFGGTNGAIVAADPALLQISSMTVELDNSEVVNESRLSGDLAVTMTYDGRLRLAGQGAVADVTQQVAGPLKIDGASVLEVQNNGADFSTTLEVAQLHLAEAGLLLNRSLGTAGEVLGAVTGPKVLFTGQAAASFLGPQQYYLSGDLESDAAVIEYAAYDGTRGVIAATTGTSLATAGPGDNVLLTEDDENFTATATLNSLAFNAENLYGSGTLNVAHVLLTRPDAGIGVTLDFGASAGTITAENWNTGVGFPSVWGVYLDGDLAGTNSLTFRGNGEFYLGAQNSFSGTVKILGSTVYVGNETSSFSHASAFVLGGADGVDEQPFYPASDLEIVGDGSDVIADSAPVEMAGPALVRLYSSTSVPADERLGAVTVTAAAAEGSTVEVGFIVDGSYTPGPAQPATLTLTSLAFASTSSNANVSLQVFGENNHLVVEGATPIELQNGSGITVFLADNNTSVALPGVHLAADAEGYVSLEASGVATLTGDLDLEGGAFFMPGNAGNLTMEGDLTMGANLGTWLFLNDPNAVQPLLTLEGNLTLAGTLNVTQNGSFVEGTWLLFAYEGDLTNNSWIINGEDGDYSLFIDETNKQVFLNAVPEPATGVLLVAGMLALCARRSRRR